MITPIFKPGIKVTPQRVAVFEALKSLGHASADEIILKVQEKAPYISPATIYNTLDKFVQMEVISRIATDGNKMFFDITSSSHIHLCTDDNSFITDAHVPELELLITDYLNRVQIPGFRVNKVQLNLVGRFEPIEAN